MMNSCQPSHGKLNRSLMRNPTFSKSLFWKPVNDQDCLICENRRSPGKHLKIVLRLNTERQTLLAGNKAA